MLLGSDHEALDQAVTLDLGPDLAIALSRGRYPKGYPHIDKNEDAVLAAAWKETYLLAVVDGHSGFEAARASIEALQKSLPRLFDVGSDDPGRAVRLGLELARQSIADILVGVTGARRASRTAIALALLHRGAGVAGCFGDIAVVHGARRRSRSLASGAAPFLDAATSLDLAEVVDVKVAPGERLILASDGVVNFLGSGWLRRLAKLQHEASSESDYVRAVVEAAFAGGAGDNTAVAVLSIPSRGNGMRAGTKVS